MINKLSVAILVDGGFFLKRYNKLYKDGASHSPEQVAKELYSLCIRHIEDDQYLYRIYYYDCKPLDKKVQHPLTKAIIDFSKSEQSKFRTAFFDELKKKRKMALRLGYLKENNNWIIRPTLTKEILHKKKKATELKENDVIYDVKQKSVDMKIGLDIATLAYKKMVNKIILISGDGDFVPAAMLAREEGIDFVLDPMWNHIDESLFEHIDGLTSTSPKPDVPK